MIIDKLANLHIYLPAHKDAIAAFLDTVSPELPNGEYAIAGDDVFARVMSYPLKPAKMCKIEAHDVYVDIQSAIIGTEGIGLYDRRVLTESEPYDDKNDVVFYAPQPPLYTIGVHEGYFAMIFPHEAHSPQTITEGCEYVKKFVIKIKYELFGGIAP
ncbi:hypothetical protein FACS1894217_06910 [Clostridia bacterium]|nr:hypothetical protein FACS1894217_06910 [Clostridia bacterium]